MEEEGVGVAVEGEEVIVNFKSFSSGYMYQS